MCAMMSPTLFEIYDKASHRPWEDATGPVRVSRHTWFVGQSWVGVLLIETQEGLIMIDAGICGQMWQIFEAIRKIGYDPERDVKLCLLSHCHIDHFSGMQLLQHYAHPIVYMSEIEKDWPNMAERHDTAGADYYMPFTPDRYYDYTRPIEFGGLSIMPVLTPGHTPGTTSFFYEDTDEKTGKSYLVGLHGGLGMNTMIDTEFTCAQAAFEARDAFRKQMLTLREKHVDISITNHPDNIHMFDRIGPDKTDYTPFVDPSVWVRQIDEKLAELNELEKNSVFQCG